MNPKHKQLAENVIKYFKNSDKSSLIPGKDLIHLLEDRDTVRSVIYSLEKDYKLIERVGTTDFRLTEKGWKFETFKKLESESKKLTLFQKFQITITLLSLLTAIILGILNYNLASEKSHLSNNNQLLKNNIDLYKDSLNSYRMKRLINDEKPTKNRSESKANLIGNN